MEASSCLVVMKEGEDSVSVADPGLILSNFDGCMRNQSTKSFKQGRKEGLGSVEYFFSCYLGVRALSAQNWCISSCFRLLQAIEN